MKKLTKNSWVVIALLATLLLAVIGAMFVRSESIRKNPDGVALIALIRNQLNLGPRHVGSDGHRQLQEFIIGKLNQSSLSVINQVWTDDSGQKLQNIAGRVNPGKRRRVVIATHYDTKREANRDTKNPQAPVPGANDGASGVAILLRLSQDNSLKRELNNIGVDLVFFDAEELDPGSFENWHPKGSTYFADRISELYPAGKPELAIVPDLVCKNGLRLEKDQSSTQNAPSLTNKLWEIGRSVNGRIFVDKTTGEVKDDHTPLNALGVPSVVLIDLNYSAFHTTHDTIDKCSADSLEAVYATIKKFLINYDRNL